MGLIKRFLIFVLIFGVLAAILDSEINKRSLCNSRLTSCAANLRALLQASMTYAIQHHPPYEYPSDFLHLQEGPKAVITRYETFICPLSGEKVRPGYCSYIGPFKNLRLADGREVWAADRPGNHGPGEGGVVLLKTGDIYYAPASDPFWRIIPVRP